MNGIIINIDPIALRLGSFELRWYSIAIILAIIIATVVSVYEAKRKKVAVDVVYDIVPYMLLAGIAGARIFHVLDHLDYYSNNPLQIVQLQLGGLAIYGALIGGGLAVIIYARLKHLSIGRLFDVLIPGLIIAQIIGRFGCIVNGDAYGGPTTLPWGFIYVHPDALIPANLLGVPTHPYPVYEMIWNSLVLFLVLKFRGTIQKNGVLSLIYLCLYSVGRFFLTFVREETIVAFGLQEAQIVAVVLFVVSLGLLGYLYRKRSGGLVKDGAQ